MSRILAAWSLNDIHRHMRVSIGDILTTAIAARSPTPTIAFLIELCREVYRPLHYDRLLRDRLELTHGKATVFCWIFQNMTAQIADILHSGLASDPAYVGAMDVDFSRPRHLQLFRNGLRETYRLRDQRCSIFYAMGENDDPLLVDRELFEHHGFEVEYEDTGARRTVFDNFDSPDHFARIEDFQRVFSGFSQLGSDRTADIALNLEELHPLLFDAFASAARTFERAETMEDYAQVALSGRRLLVGIADYLFPPRKELWRGHKVGKQEYRNRLWAYVEKTLEDSSIADSSLLSRLGGEVDRLVERFNVELHANPTRVNTASALCDLVLWLSDIIELDPKAARMPYLAYSDEWEAFIRRVIQRSEN